MAEMVLAPSRGDGKEANFIQKFGRAFVRGDAFTKLSLLVWGLGYIGHGQLIKALLVTLVQGLGLYFLGTSGIPALKKFGTLGTVQMEMQFNPVTLKNEVNNYDNSFAILLLSVIAMVIIVSLVVATMMVVQSNYLLQQQKAAGKKPNSFRQDINCYLNEKFYVTLLTLPVLGVVVFTIVPLFILIAVAFTNYDQQHMPPAALFTWVGLANFASLFGGQSLSMTFSYAFGKVLSWTLVWAFFATYQMLIATGVLMNIPSDILEASTIDGASPLQCFIYIKLPYLLSVQGPALVTDFVKNVNNFNVIYLLTQDVYITKDQAMASSSAKEVDLLVTWLFRLTQEQYNYKMAAVIGIMVFIICAIFTLVCFRFINKKEATFS